MNQEVIKKLREQYVVSFCDLCGTNNTRKKTILNITLCQFVVDPGLKDKIIANVDSNVIFYGYEVDHLEVYHQLEHLRKGTMHKVTTNQIKNAGDGEVEIEKAAYGRFLDEAITEYMAQELFKSCTYYKPTKRKDVIRDRKQYQVHINKLNELAEALNINTLELCDLIERKHHNGDKTLDQMIEQITSSKQYLAELESCLDYWEAVNHTDKLCSEGRLKYNELSFTGVCPKSKRAAKAAITRAENEIATIGAARQDQ